MAEDSMKLRLRCGDGATYEAEGSTAFVQSTAAMFQRVVLEQQLKECRARIAEHRMWERGLLRALKALESSQALAAVGER